MRYYLILGFIFQTLLFGAFKYSYIPKSVYPNELFAITVVNSNDASNKNIEFDFVDKNRQPLFSTALIVRNGNNTFYTFYFKAEDKDIIIPKLMIDNRVFLKSKIIPIKYLKKRKNFSNVLATQLKIKNSQISKYDKDNHIVTLLIEAYQSNLEDMSIYNAKESKMEMIKRDKAKVVGEFYIIISNKINTLYFSYYNTIKKKFINIKIPLKVSNSSVVTQSSLNPKESSFDRLKKYAFIFFVSFFMLMFLIKRDVFYLILGVVSFIILLTFYTPHKNICIKKNSPIYILPSSTSTISTVVTDELNTSILNTRGKYSKIEYKKNIIGWIKNENSCDN